MRFQTTRQAFLPGDNIQFRSKVGNTMVQCQFRRNRLHKFLRYLEQSDVAAHNHKTSS